jgi:fatty acid desaturase
MTAPVPPTNPDLTAKPRGSWLGILLAGGLLSTTLVVLNFLTLGFLGPLLLIVGIMAAIITLQYVIWGWWLHPILKRAQEEEDARRNA